jgi:hypothetical protein
MKKEKKIYESPQLTVVEFRVERGFATSDTLASSAQQLVQGYIDMEVQAQLMGQVDEGGNAVAGYMSGNDDHSNAGGGSSWQYADGGWF